MTWRDDFLPASWRGVPFFVDASNVSGGHRQVVHPFPRAERSPADPQRPDFYVEDTGRQPNRYEIEAFVIGEEYLQDALTLQRACEVGGVGVLVHPYLGAELQLKLSSFSRREVKGRGGMAAFALVFVDPGIIAAPAAAFDTQARVVDQADLAGLDGEALFVSEYSVDGRPNFLAESSSLVLQDLARQAAAVVDSLPPGVEQAGEAALAVAAFANAVVDTGAQALLRQPAALASTARSLIGQVSRLAAAPNNILGMTRGILGPVANLAFFGQSLDPVVGDTVLRQEQRRNQTAIATLVGISTASGLSAASAEAVPDNYNDAVALRDSLDELLGAQVVVAGDAGDDATYASLRTLRARMVEDLSARAANLVRVVPRTIQRSLPAVVLAYELYENARRDQDLVARNRVVNPVFVPAGVVLDTLDS